MVTTGVALKGFCFIESLSCLDEDLVEDEEVEEEEEKDLVEEEEEEMVSRQSIHMIYRWSKK